GVAEIVVQRGKNEALSTEDFVFTKAVICQFCIVLYVKSNSFLILGCNQESSDTNKLEFIQSNDLNAQKSVDDVDGKEQCLWKHTEASVNLNEPINEDLASIPLQIFLMHHIVGVGLSSWLQFAKV